MDGSMIDGHRPVGDCSWLIPESGLWLELWVLKFCNIWIVTVFEFGLGDDIWVEEWWKMGSWGGAWWWRPVEDWWWWWWWWWYGYGPSPVVELAVEASLDSASSLTSSHWSMWLIAEGSSWFLLATTMWSCMVWHAEEGRALVLLMGWWVSGSIPARSSRFFKCVFQWFFTSLSVRPDKWEAMPDHLLKFESIRSSLDHMHSKVGGGFFKL